MQAGAELRAAQHITPIQHPPHPPVEDQDVARGGAGAQPARLVAGLPRQRPGHPLREGQHPRAGGLGRGHKPALQHRRGARPGGGLSSSSGGPRQQGGPRQARPHPGFGTRPHSAMHAKKTQGLPEKTLEKNNNKQQQKSSMAPHLERVPGASVQRQVDVDHIAKVLARRELRAIHGAAPHQPIELPPQVALRQHPRQLLAVDRPAAVGVDGGEEARHLRLREVRAKGLPGEEGAAGQVLVGQELVGSWLRALRESHRQQQPPPWDLRVGLGAPAPPAPCTPCVHPPAQPSRPVYPVPPAAP